MQPYDYTTGQALNPLQSFIGGMNIGTSYRQNQEARLLAQAKMQQEEAARRQQEKQNLLIDAALQPGATAEDYRKLSLLMDKDQYEAAQNGYKLAKQETIDADLKDNADVYNAFNSGNPEIGIDLMKRHLDVAKSENDQKAIVTISQLLEKAENGDTEPAKLFFGFQLSAIPGGDLIIDSSAKLNDEVRKQREYPILMAQKQADLDKATSDAEKAEIEAKYAERAKIADLKKLAVDTGLSEANTNKALAETRKLNAEIAEIGIKLAGAKQHGGLDEEKIADMEVQLNNTVNTRNKNVIEARAYYDNINSGAKIGNGVGDIAIINSFMRQLSPGIVTDNDYKAAISTGGIMSQLEALKSKYDPKKPGNLLTDSQRKQFAAMSKQFLENAKRENETQLSGIRNLVKSYGLSEMNVFGSEAKPKESPQKPAASPYRTEADALSAASRQTGAAKVVEVDW
jgi:hypothetical protein